MAQFKELLEKDELKHMKEVKKEIKEENSEKQGHSREASLKEEPSEKDSASKGFSEEASVREEPSEKISTNENSEKKKGSNAWIWVAAIIAAVIILK